VPKPLLGLLFLNCSHWCCDVQILMLESSTRCWCLHVPVPDVPRGRTDIGHGLA